VTNSDADFDTLVLLFRRASSLPELPGNALRLVQIIDSGSASARDLERIICADPGLTANLLRVSNARVTGETAHGGISTIRAAILRMGQRSVRTVAVSLIVQHIANGRDIASEFHVDRFARHSLFVAFLSRYLFARRNLAHPFESRWTADEIFAGGLLHDIGFALLARVMKDSYFRVHSFAARTGVNLEASFLRIYGKSVNELACTAVAAWDLPELFSITLGAVNEPWQCKSEYTALCCINYANYLAQKNQAKTEEWDTAPILMPEVEDEIALPADEIERVLASVEDQVNTYLEQKDNLAA
jgi:HD-like signal output (HDOD) protein